MSKLQEDVTLTFAVFVQPFNNKRNLHPAFLSEHSNFWYYSKLTYYENYR